VLPVIIAFDPDLPIVVSQEMSIGGRAFVAESPFPWKELGIDVMTLHSLYRSGYVRCLPAAEAPAVGKSSLASAPQPQPQPPAKRRR
jgi:hypothetical protein